MDSAILDVITYAPISEANLVTLHEGESVYHFDIDTLYRHYIINKLPKPINPLTTNALSPIETERLFKYGATQTVALIFECEDKEKVTIQSGVNEKLAWFVGEYYKKTQHFPAAHFEGESIYNFLFENCAKQTPFVCKLSISTHYNNSYRVDDLTLISKYLTQYPAETNDNLTDIIYCHTTFVENHLNDISKMYKIVKFHLFKRNFKTVATILSFVQEDDFYWTLFRKSSPLLNNSIELIEQIFGNSYKKLIKFYHRLVMLSIRSILCKEGKCTRFKKFFELLMGYIISRARSTLIKDLFEHVSDLLQTQTVMNKYLALLSFEYIKDYIPLSRKIESKTTIDKTIFQELFLCNLKELHNDIKNPKKLFLDIHVAYLYSILFNTLLFRLYIKKKPIQYNVKNTLFLLKELRDGDKITCFAAYTFLQNAP